MKTSPRFASSLVASCAALSCPVGSETGIAHDVLTGHGFVIFVMELNPDGEAFGYVRNKNYPDGSEYGYLDMDGYARTGMMRKADWQPMPIKDALKLPELM